MNNIDGRSRIPLQETAAGTTANTGSLSQALPTAQARPRAQDDLFVSDQNPPVHATGQTVPAAQGHTASQPAADIAPAVAETADGTPSDPAREPPTAAPAGSAAAHVVRQERELFADATAALEQTRNVQESNAVRLVQAPNMFAAVLAPVASTPADGHVVASVAPNLVRLADSETGLKLSADRAAISGSGTLHTGGQDLTLGVTNSATFVNANASLAFDNGFSLGGLVGATSGAGIPGVGFNLAHNFAGAAGIAAGVFGLGDANYKTSIVNSNEQGEVDIRSHANTLVAAQLTGSVGSHGVSVGTRLYHEATADKEVWTTVPMKVAQQAKDANGFFAAKERGLSAKKRTVNFDALKTPSLLQPGQKARERRMSATDKSLAVGAAGFTLSVHSIRASSSAATLRRNESDGSLVDVSIEVASSTSQLAALDASLLGTMSHGKNRNVAEGLVITADPNKENFDHVLRKNRPKMSFGKHFSLPQEIDLESVSKAKSLKEAVNNFNELKTEHGEIKSYFHQDISGNSTKFALLPIIKTLFGSAKTGIGFQKEHAQKLKQLHVQKDEGIFITGTQRQTMTSLLFRGETKKSLSHLNVLSAQRSDNTQFNADAGPAMQHNPADDVFVFEHTVQAAGHRELNALLKWLNKLQPRMVVDGADPKQTAKLPSFDVSVTVSLSVSIAEKNRLLAEGFFPELTPPSASSPPTQAEERANMAAFNERFADLINKKSPEKAALRVARALGKEMEVYVNTSLPTQLKKQSAELHLKDNKQQNQAKVSSRSGRVVQQRAHKQAAKAVAVKSLVQHPLLKRADNPEGLAGMKSASEHMGRTASAILERKSSETVVQVAKNEPKMTRFGLSGRMSGAKLNQRGPLMAKAKVTERG